MFKHKFKFKLSNYIHYINTLYKLYTLCNNNNYIHYINIIYIYK